MLLQNALKIFEELPVRDVRLRRDVVGALDVTKLGILRDELPDGVLPLVDKIQRKVEILQASRMWTVEWDQGKSYPSILVGLWF